jgi:hypothetical protein
MALRVYRHLFRRVGLSLLAEKSVAAPIERSLISRAEDGGGLWSNHAPPVQGFFWI